MQKAAMRYGIQHEDEAANQYADQFGTAVYPVGFINPSLPHLGCSPDRRVYDPSENDPWGLLEIKCSPSDYLSDLNYLKHNGRTGSYTVLYKSNANVFRQKNIEFSMEVNFQRKVTLIRDAYCFQLRQFSNDNSLVMKLDF